MFCWYYKFKISDVLNGDGELTDNLQRHIDNCLSCRHFYQVATALAAGVTEHKSTSRLNDNVVIASDCSAKPVKVGFFRMYGMSAAAGIILIFSIGLILMNSGPLKRPAHNPDWGNKIDPIAQLFNISNLSIKSLTSGTGRPLDSITVSLEGELALLSEDANAAFGSMLGCLPVDRDAKELWDAISVTMNQ